MPAEGHPSMMRAGGMMLLLAMAMMIVAEVQGQHPQGHSRHLLVYDPSLPAQGVSLYSSDNSFRSIALFTCMQYCSALHMHAILQQQQALFFVFDIGNLMGISHPMWPSGHVGGSGNTLSILGCAFCDSTVHVYS